MRDFIWKYCLYLQLQSVNFVVKTADNVHFTWDYETLRNAGG